MAAPSSEPEHAQTAEKTPFSKKSLSFPSSKAFGRSMSLFGTAILSPSTILSEAERFNCTRFFLKVSMTLLGRFRPKLADTLVKLKSYCIMQLQLKGSRNQAQAIRHQHLPTSQQHLPPSLHILLPTQHHQYHLLTIKLDPTHQYHQHFNTRHPPQLTLHRPHTLHHPIHHHHTLHRHHTLHPPILLPHHIPLRQFIHLLQPILLLLEYTLHRHTDKDLRHSQSKKQHGLYNPLPALVVIRNLCFLCFVYFILRSICSMYLICSHDFIISKKPSQDGFLEQNFDATVQFTGVFVFHLLHCFSLFQFRTSRVPFNACSNTP